MSEEQLKAFLEAVKADAGLQEKLKGAEDVDAVVVIAKAAGFVIDVEKLQKAQVAELSDVELETASGGIRVSNNVLFTDCGFSLWCTVGDSRSLSIFC
jgi:predicted ribosomally synthesized peptide with nif11-like leader